LLWNSIALSRGFQAKPRDNASGRFVAFAGTVVAARNTRDAFDKKEAAAAFWNGWGLAAAVWFRLRAGGRRKIRYALWQY
jgi:hypothetical protein